MKIGELAGRSGLNPSAIRYYEKKELLSTPHRVGGQRRYASDALDRVLLIRFASEMGFTLDDTKVFLNGLRSDAPVGPRWKKLHIGKSRRSSQTCSVNDAWNHFWSTCSTAAAVL